MSAATATPYPHYTLARAIYEQEGLKNLFTPRNVLEPEGHQRVYHEIAAMSPQELEELIVATPDRVISQLMMPSSLMRANTSSYGRALVNMVKTGKTNLTLVNVALDIVLSEIINIHRARTAVRNTTGRRKTS